MEKLIDVTQLTTNPSYSPTSWKDGSTPALNAENLNKIETAIQVCRAAENNIIGEVNKTQGNNVTLQNNINEVNKNYQAADTSINNRIDSLTLSNINDQTADIIILDGGNGKPTTEQET